MDDDVNKLVCGEANRRSLSQSPLEQTAKVILKKFELNVSGNIGGDGRIEGRINPVVIYAKANGIENVEAKQDKFISPRKHNPKRKNKTKGRPSDTSENSDDNEGLTNPAIESNIDYNEGDDFANIEKNNNEDDVNKVEVIYIHT